MYIYILHRTPALEQHCMEAVRYQTVRYQTEHASQAGNLGGS